MNDLTMSKKERLQLAVVQRVVAGELSRSDAASLLSLSVRQVYRLVGRYRARGDGGLVHRLRGCRSNRIHDLPFRRTVLALYKEHYDDYGPTLFCEQLWEVHRLRLPRETARRWLLEAGLLKRSRSAPKHRRCRPRKSEMGAMMQLDGSPHAWFEDRGPMVTLLVLVDDATNRVWLRFRPSEDTEGVFKAFEGYIRRYGIPQMVYTDRGTVYYQEDGQTQFGRALEAMGVRLVFANSPEAKGRVERQNGILQDRLVKALRQAKISTIEDANRFLEEYFIEDYNDRFAKCIGVPDVHRDGNSFDLKALFYLEDTRKVQKDNTISISVGRWQIERQSGPYLAPRPGANVVIRYYYLDQTIHLFHAGQELKITRLEDRTKKPCQNGKPPDDGRYRINDWEKKVMNLSTLQ